MPALSILHMHFTMTEMERIRDIQLAEAYASRPADAETTHYWHIERKAKRKKNGKTNWIFVKHFYGTKSEAAEMFRKHYQGQGYRLRHILTYSS